MPRWGWTVFAALLCSAVGFWLVGDALAAVIGAAVGVAFGSVKIDRDPAEAAVEPIEDPELARKKVLRAFPKKDHEMSEVALADLPRLDLAFYRRVTEELEREGFRLGANVEDVTSSSLQPQARTATRVLLGPRSQVCAHVIHIPAGGRDPSSLPMHGSATEVRVVRLLTELDDHAVLVTLVTDEPPQLAVPPFVHREVLPASTPLADAVAHHRARIQNASGVPIEVPDMATWYERARARMRRLTEFHHDRGGPTEKELARMVGDSPPKIDAPPPPEPPEPPADA